MKKIDLTGKRFNRLIVECCVPRQSKTSGVKWQCRCDCGKIVITTGWPLRVGKIKSCGCRRNELISKVNATHNNTSGRKKTPEYAAWVALRERCQSPTHISYKYYGERGISVCSRWLDSFENFLHDMGKKPSKQHSLDRIDSNLGYSAENCRWSLWTTQNRNKRDSKQYKYNDKSYTLSDLAEISNVSYTTLRARIRRGWQIKRAVEEVAI